MTLNLKALDDRQLEAALKEHGTKAALAGASGMSHRSVRREFERRGLTGPRRAPRLTRESLHRALEPPNTCKVKAFLDSLDGESRQVVEEALSYDKKDFASGALRDWLIASGFREQDVPGSDSINDHRAGRRPCRCKG